MDFKTVFPVLTLLIGFFIKEVETRYSTKREMRRAMSRGLAELLDLYCVFAVHQEVIEKRRMGAEWSPGGELKMREMLRDLLSSSTKAMETYESVVIDVAGENAIWGAELRALRRQIQQVMGIISIVSEASESSEYSMRAVEEAINSVRDSIRDCVDHLAERLGRATSKSARRYILAYRASDPKDEAVLSELRALEIRHQSGTKPQLEDSV